MKTFIYISLIFFTGFSFAQTGKLKGKVTDGSISSYPQLTLLFLILILERQVNLMELTKLHLFHLASYEVRFSVIGYDSKTFDVEIAANKITELNVELEIKAIELQSVEVTDLNRCRIKEIPEQA